MKTIYVVTTGTYSDYKIDSVFDSKELAQSYIDSFSTSGWYKMSIEEFKLNPFEKQVKEGYLPYFLRMTKEGKCTQINICDSSFELGEKPFFDVDDKICHKIFAKDEKHAIKILNEIRAQLVATNKWGYSRINNW